MINIMAIELEAGACVEVTQADGLNAGTLLGYAILFSGGWDAWIKHITMMTCVGNNLSSRDEAVDAIRSAF